MHYNYILFLKTFPIFALKIYLSQYQRTDLQNEEIGFAWVYGTIGTFWDNLNFCKTIEKRICVYEDIYELYRQGRNMCDFAFYFPRFADWDHVRTANSNVNINDEDNCGKFGSINFNEDSKAKVWCCKNVHLEESSDTYQQHEIPENVCGVRKLHSRTRWDNSIRQHYTQRKICGEEDFLRSVYYMSETSKAGWIVKDGNIVKSLGYGGSNIPVYCCDRKSLRVGQQCQNNSDCSTWLCRGVCIKAYGDYYNEGFYIENNNLISLGKTLLLGFLISLLFIIILVKITKCCCPARGLACFMCRCKRLR